MNIVKVLELPTDFEPDTLYIVKVSETQFALYVSDKSGTYASEMKISVPFVLKNSAGETLF